MHNRHAAGFTLIEIMIVMSIVLVCAYALSFIDLHTYRHDALNDERMRIVALLIDARAKAMRNVDEHAHGVALQTDGSCISFVGDHLATALHVYDNRTVPAYPIVFGSSTPDEIVFAQESGDTPDDSTIEIRDPARTASVYITINHEGAIGW